VCSGHAGSLPVNSTRSRATTRGHYMATPGRFTQLYKVDVLTYKVAF